MPIKNKLPELREHEIQTQCMNYLKAKGFYCLRLNSGKYSVGEGRNRRFIMGQEAGTPDILAIKYGKCYFFEIKKPKGKLTFYQKHKMKELEGYGARCYVIHSLEEMQGIIK